MSYGGKWCTNFKVKVTVRAYILIECSDLAKIRKKYFEELSLYSLFRNVNPEKMF